MYSGSEYFESTRPGLEDMTSGRFDPLEVYTGLGEAVISLYADTAKEIGVSFPFSAPSGDLNARAEALRELVRKQGVTLTETRAEEKMEEVYEALKAKVLPRFASSWDAQDVLASNAVLKKLQKEREALLRMQQFNAVALKVYGQLVGFIAKAAPPPFGNLLTKYEEWFADYATKSIEDQLAAVNAEIPKVETQHKKVKAARTTRIAARLAAEKKKKADAASWKAYAVGGALGLVLLGFFWKGRR